MIYAFWGIIVFLLSVVVFSAVFLIAINNGNIKITPELEEFLNKIPFWNQSK